MNYPVLPLRVLAILDRRDVISGALSHRIEVELLPGCTRELSVSSQELRAILETLGEEREPPPPARPAPSPPPPPQASPEPIAVAGGAPPPPPPAPRPRPAVMQDEQGNPVGGAAMPSSIDPELGDMF